MHDISTRNHIIVSNEDGNLELRYKFSDGTSSFVRELDEYESEMVVAAYETGFNAGRLHERS